MMITTMIIQLLKYALFIATSSTFRPQISRPKIVLASIFFFLNKTFYDENDDDENDDDDDDDENKPLVGGGDDSPPCDRLTASTIGGHQRPRRTPLNRGLILLFSYHRHTHHIVTIVYQSFYQLRHWWAPEATEEEDSY